MIRLARPIGFVLLLALTAPAALSAQRCAAGRGVTVAARAGLVHHGVANGVDGVELGGELRAAFDPVLAAVSYERVNLETGEIDPNVVRARLGVRLLDVIGWEVCALAFGGASFMNPASDGDTDARVLAGGAGAAVERALPLGAGTLTPFVAVRGGAASSSGSVLGLDVSETGLSLGADVGAALTWGAFGLAAEASFDGFAPALGVTPYPDRAIRLSAGVRF